MNAGVPGYGVGGNVWTCPKCGSIVPVGCTHHCPSVTRWGTTSPRVTVQPTVTLRFMDPESLCPDLLGLDYIGEADHFRGRVVRAFFWLMQLWPKLRSK